MALSDELAYMGVADLALRIGRRDLSPVEVVEARNPSLNAFVYYAERIEKAGAILLDIAAWPRGLGLGQIDCGSTEEQPRVRRPSLSGERRSREACTRKVRRRFR